MNPLIIYLGVFILKFSGAVRLPENFYGHEMRKFNATFTEGPTGYCSNDPFLSSDPYNGKVFLFPWMESERRGDWHQNLGYCDKHCAEMVTIQSDEENNYFHWFMRSNNMMTNPGAWLGAQIVNTTSPSTWMNHERVRFSNPAPREYNEPGVTCLHVGWDNTNKWWNYYCSLNTMRIVCQRRILTVK